MPPWPSSASKRYRPSWLTVSTRGPKTESSCKDTRKGPHGRLHAQRRSRPRPGGRALDLRAPPRARASAPGSSAAACATCCSASTDQRLGRRDRRAARGGDALFPQVDPDRPPARDGHRRDPRAPLRGHDAARRERRTRTAAAPTPSLRRRHRRRSRAPRLHRQRDRGRPARRRTSSIRSTVGRTSPRSVLRAVGNAERALRRGRPARAARRALRARRSSSTSTRPRARAIAPTLDTFRKVSAERVRDEWVKTMKAKRPSRAFEVMREHGHPRRHVPGAARGRRLRAEQVARLRRVGPRDGVPRRVRRRPGAAHRRAAARRRQAALARLQRQDAGLHVLRARAHRRRDRRAHRHAPPLLQRRARASSRLVRHHLFHYDDVDRTRRCAAGSSASDLDALEDLYALNEADVRGKGRDSARPTSRRSRRSRRTWSGCSRPAPRSRRATSPSTATTS